MSFYLDGSYLQQQFSNKQEDGILESNIIIPLLLLDTEAISHIKKCELPKKALFQNSRSM